MPTEKHIKASELAEQIGIRIELDKASVRRAALEMATYGEAQAVRITDDEGKVNLGQYKDGWGSRSTPSGAEWGNDAPHAPTIEWGRRPLRPGPPFEPIYEWVVKKLVGAPPADGQDPVTADNAEQVAWNIQRAIHRRGTKGREILGQSHKRVLAYGRQAILRELRRGRKQ